MIHGFALDRAATDRLQYSSVTAANRLIVFLKAPRSGEVKTRLARAVGNEEACRIYRSLVETVIRTLKPLPDVEFRYTPEDAAAEISSWLAPGWSAISQGPGDLGQRMLRAFADAFAGGARKAVIIGSDCPEIGLDDIERAWRALDEHDLVLGPAADGGYWLIGLTEAQIRNTDISVPGPRPAAVADKSVRLTRASACGSLFDRMPWGSDQVLVDTLARARAARLRVFSLRTLSDIDTEADWQAYQSSLSKRQ